MVSTDKSPALRQLRGVLTTWSFVIALALLLANDFWLKAAYPGFLTGKLSDVAGIAVVTFLLLPFARRAVHAFAVIGLAFIWWKSPLSQSFIDLATQLLPFTLHRVVDYSDLVALAIMPACAFAWRRQAYEGRSLGVVRRCALPPIAILTSFALMATSSPSIQELMRVRSAVPDHALDRDAIFRAMKTVSERHGLHCQACTAPDTGATFIGDHLRLDYTFVDGRQLDVAVIANYGGFPFGKSAIEYLDPFVGDLKRQLAATQRGLEIVYRLDAGRR
jgi:hypothetical protein